MLFAALLFLGGPPAIVPALDVSGIPVRARGAEIQLGEPALLRIPAVLHARYGRQPVVVAAPEWRIATRGDETVFEAEAFHPLVRARFRLAARAGDGRLRLDVRLHYPQAVEVEHERIELVAEPAGARALRRDLHLHEIDTTPSRLDATTPKVVELSGGRIRLLGEDDFPTGELQRREGALHIALEIDDAGNHPFRRYPCTRKHRSPRAAVGRALPPGAAAPRRERLDLLERAAGSSVQRSVTLFVGGGFAPVWAGRVPYPYEAAMVFVDHADQSSRARLEGLTFPRAGAGFGGRALPFTKTLFLRADPGRQLDAPAFHALARRLVALGVEVAPHSITDRTDDRKRVEDGLRVFRELGAATWVDHSPVTNCEALTNRGAVRGSPYYIVDLLKRAGFRYAWAGLDPVTPGLNVLAAERPGDRRFLFYDHPRVDAEEDPLWLFPSQWAFRTRAEMLRLYSDEQLSALLRERGVHLAHSYLDFYHPKNHLRARSLLVRRGQRYELARSFDARLAAIAQLRDERRLWVTTVRDLGDHLRRVRRVRIEHLPDGTVRLENTGRDPVKGMQLLAPAAAGEARAEGAALARQGDLVVIGLDLAPGATATLRFPGPGR